MTEEERREEVRYRTEERLAIMGFTDPQKTPLWASEQAEKEAELSTKVIDQLKKLVNRQ